MSYANIKPIINKFEEMCFKYYLLKQSRFDSMPSSIYNTHKNCAANNLANDKKKNPELIASSLSLSLKTDHNCDFVTNTYYWDKQNAHKIVQLVWPFSLNASKCDIHKLNGSKRNDILPI